MLKSDGFDKDSFKESVILYNNINWKEKEGGWLHLDFNCAGVNPDDIHVELFNGQSIWIYKDGIKFVKSLPEKVDLDTLEGELKYGLLTLKIKKLKPTLQSDREIIIKK